MFSPVPSYQGAITRSDCPIGLLRLDTGAPDDAGPDLPLLADEGGDFVAAHRLYVHPHLGIAPADRGLRERRAQIGAQLRRERLRRFRVRERGVEADGGISGN